MSLVDNLPGWAQPIASNPLNALLTFILVQVIRTALRPWVACLSPAGQSSHFLLLYPTPAEAKLRGVPGNLGAAIGPFSLPPILPAVASGGGGFHGGNPAAEAMARRDAIEAGAKATRMRWRNYLRRLTQAEDAPTTVKSDLLAARSIARTRTQQGVWAHPSPYPGARDEEVGYSSLPTYHTSVSVWRRYTPKTLALFDGAGLILSEQERAAVADPRRDALHNAPTTDSSRTISAPIPAGHPGIPEGADASQCPGMASKISTTDTDPNPIPVGHPGIPEGADANQCPAMASKETASEPKLEPKAAEEEADALPPGHPPVSMDAGATQCPGLVSVTASSQEVTNSQPVVPQEPALSPSAPTAEVPKLVREEDAEAEYEDTIGGYCGPAPSSGAAGSLLIGINGKVYDVSSGRKFYGPGGPYASFAGRDATLGLAKNSFDADVLPSLEDKPLFVPLGPGADKDLAALSSDAGPAEVAARTLTKAERYALNDWIEMFDSKYGVVGELVAE